MAEPSPLFKTLAIEPGFAEEASPGAARPPTPTPEQNAVAIQMIRIALSAIWQQFVVAVAHLFTLASCASVFVLALTIPDPNTRQLVMLGGYALFVLAANFLVIGSRRK